MELLSEETLKLQGWSLFSNIERPHAAIVMRDPIDTVIKGVRYQVVPVQEENGAVIFHKFIFETWCYKARGPIRHHTFLSFVLQNRQKYDARVARYVSDLKIMNKNFCNDERLTLSALKCAAFVIDQINFNEHFDVLHALQRFSLIRKEDMRFYAFDCDDKEKYVSF